MEFKWINSLLKKAGNLAKGVGDDAFVCGKKFISADMAVEGTHFRLDWSTPSQAIEKCLLANFSDINAMGGKATAILFSVCMNKKWSEKIREEISDALVKTCKKYKVKILGGDTTGGNLGVFSITVFGETKGKPLLRSSAKIGDNVWLAGNVSGLKNGPLTINPPLHLGPKLSKTKGIGACIDTSDSIAESLQHIAEKSNVKIEINVDKIAAYVGARRALPLKIFLNSSEDFCLIFTAGKTVKIKNCKLIGTVKSGSGVYKNGKKIEVKGWVHF